MAHRKTLQDWEKFSLNRRLQLIKNCPITPIGWESFKEPYHGS
jgi:hypothetical protein